jgi:hypothetical protein
VSAVVERIDLKALHKSLYSANAQPVVIDVPALSFIMVDGAGDPNNSATYAEAIEALYGTAYTLKFALKKGPRALDFTVMPLEGLWWSPDMGAFVANDRAQWLWTAMIMLPDVITGADVEDAVATLKRKKPSEALTKLRLETFREGRAAQFMHVGPYSAEGPGIQRLHDFIADQGGRLSGKHHEIYLGDPRRSAPEKLKTIIRQPFAV